MEAEESGVAFLVVWHCFCGGCAGESWSRQLSAIGRHVALVFRGGVDHLCLQTSARALPSYEGPLESHLHLLRRASLCKNFKWLAITWRQLPGLPSPWSPSPTSPHGGLVICFLLFFEAHVFCNLDSSSSFLPSTFSRLESGFIFLPA